MFYDLYYFAAGVSFEVIWERDPSSGKVDELGVDSRKCSYGECKYSVCFLPKGDAWRIGKGSLVHNGM